MVNFACGMITMGYLVAGVFFLRFWTRMRDALFLAFAAAFGLLAIHEALLAVFQIREEHRSLVFLVRLAAFVVIGVAILLKNIGASSCGHSSTGVEPKRVARRR